jgi:1-acyl-sn-glycerol-3-phosphate acyltransferase
MLASMSWLRSVGLALFTLWVWASSFSWMLFGALVTLVLLTLRFPYQKVHLWLTAPVFSSVLKLVTIRLNVTYHRGFDPERRSVFAQNHINLLDGHLASAVIPHAFSGLMNAWQFKIPIYGWLMSMSKGIPVRRARRDRILAQISEAAAERKRIGMSVLTFPEGHRTLDGNVRPFRRGVFLMARNAGMPMVPIAVRGLYAVNNKRSRFFFPLRQVDVFVGPQFETEGLDDDQIGELADELRRRTQHWVQHGEWLETTRELPDRPAAE